MEQPNVSFQQLLNQPLRNGCHRNFWKRLNHYKGASLKNGPTYHICVDHLVVALTSICNTEHTALKGVYFGLRHLYIIAWLVVYLCYPGWITQTLWSWSPLL